MIFAPDSCSLAPSTSILIAEPFFRPAVKIPITFLGLIVPFSQIRRISSGISLHSLAIWLAGRACRPVGFFTTNSLVNMAISPISYFSYGLFSTILMGNIILDFSLFVNTFIDILYEKRYTLCCEQMFI